jgi:UDP-N-acetylglucosamine acyltransferase
MSLQQIDPKARIGKNVIISPFVTIMGDVEIGDNCWIGPNVVIMDGARIGNSCKIYPGAIISAEPQDLKYSGEYTTVEIGNNSTIREFVTINKGTKYSMKTSVGSHCLIMAYSHIAHDCKIGNHCILANNSALAGHIEVEDYAILGGVSAVHQFVKIGQHSFISGGSLVRKDVPPYVRAAKEPLSYVGINSVGLRRRGYNDERINRIHDIYRIIFVKNKNLSFAINEVEASIEDSSEKDTILQFIRNSERGIMKGYTNGVMVNRYEDNS